MMTPAENDIFERDKRSALIFCIISFLFFIINFHPLSGLIEDYVTLWFIIALLHIPIYLSACYSLPRTFLILLIIAILRKMFPPSE